MFLCKTLNVTTVLLSVFVGFLRAQKMSMVRTKGKRCNPDIVDISEKDLLRERFARYFVR